MTISSRLIVAYLFICLFRDVTQAQDKLPVKFGKVTPADFAVLAPGTDSAAGAVVIADYGKSFFKGNEKEWFTLVHKRSCRIKILKKEAFSAATIEIPLYVKGGDMERIEDLKAITYNLEGGQVIETKLDDKSVFTEKVDNNHLLKKFAFPAVKEGSMIEFTYTLNSPFFYNLPSWTFQWEYPCLWSEYEADIPNFFQYVTLVRGFLPFAVNTTEGRNSTFRLLIPNGTGRTVGATRADGTAYSFNDIVAAHRWVMKNIPAMKLEPFTTTLDNYKARVDFQIARFNFPDVTDNEVFMSDWSKASRDLLDRNDFGADLDMGNGWMDEDLAVVTKSASSSLDKTRMIYAFVRDNFTCTSHNRLFTDNSIKTVFKNRSGSEAELNLLLTALLRHTGLMADPVILSTRANGFTHEIYPLINRFNYVVSKVTIDNASYYLDASESWLGFSNLPGKCYNGYARVIDKENPTAVYLDANDLKENKKTLVFLSGDGKGGFTGRLQITPGVVEAGEIRQQIRKSGRKDYLKSLQSAYSGGMAITDMQLDSLDRPDDPLAIAFDLTITPDSPFDVIYFNPMLGVGRKKNPFIAVDRSYPVEMPYAMDETYMLTMDVPDGYEVEEQPKSTRITFNGDQGFFEYLLVKGQDNVIQFRSRVRLNQANFKAEDYASLREFFGYIVQKQSEQIVFKKKKA